jgi:membrane protein
VIGDQTWHDLRRQGTTSAGVAANERRDRRHRFGAGVKTALEMIKQTFGEWSDDKGPRLGASLSYYTVFSMAPLLLLVISIAGLVFGPAAAEGRIFGELRGLLGSDAARLVQTVVAKASRPQHGILGTVISIGVLVIGATGVVVELQDALNSVWKVAPKPNRGLWGVIRTRLISVAMILTLGFLLMVSLVVSAALAALGGWLRGLAGGAVAVGWILDATVSLGVIATLIALIYKVLPDAVVSWRDVWIGAGVTALLFLLGKYLIGLYIGRASVGSAFGAAGSLAVLLVWVYYSAQIMLLGAEFTRVFANRFGSKVRPSKTAVEVKA